MLETARWVSGKIQEFIKRIGDLEDDTEETKKEVAHLRRELELLHKGMNHSEKIQAHQGQAMVDLEQRIKKLERDKHSLATTAGIAKKTVKKLKEEQKRRH
jgi:chromosome segregation ATPase